MPGTLQIQIDGKTVPVEWRGTSAPTPDDVDDIVSAYRQKNQTLTGAASVFAGAKASASGTTAPQTALGSVFDSAISGANSAASQPTPKVKGSQPVGTGGIGNVFTGDLPTPQTMAPGKSLQTVQTKKGVVTQPGYDPAIVPVSPKVKQQQDAQALADRNASDARKRAALPLYPNPAQTQKEQENVQMGLINSGADTLNQGIGNALSSVVTPIVPSSVKGAVGTVAQKVGSTVAGIFNPVSLQNFAAQVALDPVRAANGVYKSTGLETFVNQTLKPLVNGGALVNPTNEQEFLQQYADTRPTTFGEHVQGAIDTAMLVFMAKHGYDDAVKTYGESRAKSALKQVTENPQVAQGVQKLFQPQEATNYDPGTTPNLKGMAKGSSTDTTGSTIGSPTNEIAPQDQKGSVQSGGFAFSNARAGEFRYAISAAADAHPHGAAVQVKPNDFYSDPGTKLFLSADHSAGVAVSADGDLVSVFKHPASKVDINGLLAEAVSHANRLDAYDTGGKLPDLYASHGFRPVAQVPYDAELAPPGLKGSPNVVLMVRDASGTSGLPEGKWADIRDKVPTLDWDSAVDAQHAAVERAMKGTSAEKPPVATPESTGLSMASRSAMSDTLGTEKPTSISGDDHATLYEKGQQALQKGFDADGTIKTLAENGQPASDAQIGIFAAHRDGMITELKQLNGKLDSDLTPEARSQALSDKNDLLGKIKQFDQHLDEVKAANGRSLSAFKIGQTIDYGDIDQVKIEAQRIKPTLTELPKGLEGSVAEIASRDARIAELEKERDAFTSQNISEARPRPRRQAIINQIEALKGEWSEANKPVPGVGKGERRGAASVITAEDVKNLGKRIEIASKIVKAHLQLHAGLPLEEFVGKVQDFFKTHLDTDIDRQAVIDLAGQKETRTKTELQTQMASLKNDIRKNTSSALESAAKKKGEIEAKKAAADDVRKAQAQAKELKKRGDEAAKREQETDDAVAKAKAKADKEAFWEASKVHDSVVKEKTRIAEKEFGDQWKYQDRVFKAENDIADLKSQIDEGRYRVPTKREAVVTEELKQLQTEKQQWASKVQSQLKSLEPKTVGQKLTHLQTEAVISSPNVFEKIPAGSFFNQAGNLINEPVGYLAGKLPSGVKGKNLASIAEREGKAPFSPSSGSGERLRTFFPSKEAFNNAKTTIKTGVTPTSAILGDVTKAGPVSRLHGAATSLFMETPEFRASERARTDTAKNRGLDVSDPKVQESIRTASALDAQNQIMRQKNALGSLIGDTIRKGQTIQTSSPVTTAGIRLGATVAKFFVPVVNMALNVTGRALEFGGVGPAKAFIEHMSAIKSKQLTSEQADTIIRGYSRAGTAGIIAYACIKAPDEVQKMLDSLGLAGHGPVGDAFRYWLAATKGYNESGVSGSAKGVTKELAHNTPGFEGAMSAGEAIKGRGSPEKAATNVLATLNPGIIKWLAGFMDKGEAEDRLKSDPSFKTFWDYIHADPVKRDQSEPMNIIKAGAPWLRTQVPSR